MAHEGRNNSDRHQPLYTKVQVTIGERPHYIANIIEPLASGLLAASKRGPSGVHLSRLGGRDALAELDRISVPFETFADPKRGTGNRRCWVSIQADIRPFDIHAMPSPA